MYKELVDRAKIAGFKSVKLTKRHIPSDLTKSEYNKPYINPNSLEKHTESIGNF